MAELPSFWRLNNSPLYVHITFSLSIHLLRKEDMEICCSTGVKFQLCKMSALSTLLHTAVPVVYSTALHSSGFVKRETSCSVLSPQQVERGRSMGKRRKRRRRRNSFCYKAWFVYLFCPQAASATNNRLLWKWKRSFNSRPAAAMPWDEVSGPAQAPRSTCTMTVNAESREEDELNLKKHPP